MEFRLSRVIPSLCFESRLPSYFLSILLDESNINNQNFILRRSTGFSQAFASVSFVVSSHVDSFLCSLACEPLPL